MMRRRRRNDLPKRLLLYTILLLIGVMGYKIYRVWFETYSMSHPQIIEAVTTNYNEEQPLEGILLWDEQLIYAPKEGILNYPSPRPHIAAKGEIVAAIDGTAVKAPYEAYFYPGLDGQEGNWVYPKLWPDFSPFPEITDAPLIENGTRLNRGDPIGKLVPQPQVLRCIAYLDSTPSLERALASKENATIRLRTEFDGKDRKADVVAVKSNGPKLKVYLRLPFFPPEVLRSRIFRASVITDIQKGLMVPDTAVITKGGHNMVFVVQGNTPELRVVEGFPADEGDFFIEKGVEPGSKLILNADALSRRMGDENIRIW